MASFGPLSDALLAKWPLKFVEETREYACGWCSQVLTVNTFFHDFDVHFKICKKNKETGFLMTCKELSRKLDQTLDHLKSEISEIKNKVDNSKNEIREEKNEEMKAVILKVKAEIRKEMETKLAKIIKNNLEQLKKSGEKKEKDISTVSTKINVLEKKIHEKLRKMDATQTLKMAEAQTLKVQLKIELAHLKTQIQTVTEKLKKSDGGIQHMETQVMNALNLVAYNYLFQPSYMFTIKNFRAKLSQGALELTSRTFQWMEYPVHCRAKFHLRANDCLYASLCLEDEGIETIPQIPQIFYLLKSKRGYSCRPTSELRGNLDLSSLREEKYLAHKSWLENVENDSVEIEFYVEPSPMAELVYSYDGTLDWTMENYSRRLELEEDGRLPYQTSPYFYTSENGYRVQVRLSLRGDPAVRVVFLTGKFDAYLPPAFPHRTTLTLINAKYPERNIVRTTEQDNKKLPYYVIRICSLEDLEGQVVNDALVWKVTIESR